MTPAKPDRGGGTFDLCIDEVSTGVILIFQKSKKTWLFNTGQKAPYSRQCGQINAQIIGLTL